MLRTNKFYFIPVVNPDGLNYIEEMHLSNHNNIAIPEARKNMNPNGNGLECEPSEQGVDLNRNFGTDWKLNGEFKSKDNHCFEFYAGKEPFSEPET
jgi:murein tripeptide amidase MpaA